MDMELSEIEAFVTISRAGGFTRAAGILHLSQPAISRRIELLERELGAPVFERLPGGIRLTQAGESFLPYAQQISSIVLVIVLLAPFMLLTLHRAPATKCSMRIVRWEPKHG